MNDINTFIVKKTKLGNITVKVETGDVVNGIQVFANNTPVLEAYFDERLDNFTVSSLEDNKTIGYKYELTGYIQNDLTIKDLDESMLLLATPHGFLEIIEVDSPDFNGITIWAMDMMIAKVEFYTEKETLNVIVWNQYDDDFTHKVTFEKDEI